MLVSILAMMASLPVYAGGSASTFKKENKLGANLWNVHSAIDGDLQTCWMPARDSKNAGEWLMLEIPKSTVDKLGMNIGWEKSETTWTDYPRVKSVRVQAFSYDDAQNLVPGKAATATFADQRGWQVVDLTDLPVGNDTWSGRVKITVTDIYPGHDYPVMGLSELQLYLKEFDAKITVSGSGDTSALVDGNPRTTWRGSGPLTVDSDGFSISSVGLVQGPKSGARPKTVTVRAGGRAKTTELADSASVQWLEVPGGGGYNGGAWGGIEIEIDDVYGSGDPAIGELKGRATAFEGI